MIDQDDTNGQAVRTLSAAPEDRAFGFKAGSAGAPTDAEVRIVKFIYAAFDVGADAEAISKFLNDLNGAVATKKTGEQI